MARRATVLRHVVDVQGREWAVREERPTEHGWPVLLGWPVEVARGQGGGGPRVIITPELAAYLDAMRLTPAAVHLPLGRTALKRLRAALGVGWREANAAWWAARCLDTTATIEDFRAVHGKSAGAVSNHRRNKEG